MKSRGQVEQLKRKWVEDPCWDLEDTEGFEEYEQELLHFRLDMEQQWKREKDEKEEVTLDDNLLISVLMSRVGDLEERVDSLEEKLYEQTRQTGRNRRR